jgi:CheY-like chemotaxis protein
MELPVIAATPRSLPVEPLRVLIADDDPDTRDAMEAAVSCLGFACTTARDGAEAWQMYEEDRADVILSDWTMPRMDGFELCERVRADDRRPYTHFIFVTGNRDKSH